MWLRRQLFTDSVYNKDNSDDDDDGDGDGDGNGDSDGELVFIGLITTLVLNFSRKSTIAVTGSTALCSVVPVTATTLMTGISLSNFSFRVRFNSKRWYKN